jgi:tol-pal system protein YbgF
MAFLRRALFAVALAFVPTFAQAQDPAELLVRVNRLENQLRQLSGQIEQLQFENRRLQDQLGKFQKDVDLRFQDMQTAPKPGAPAPAQPRAATPPAAPPPAAPPPAQPQKRSDVFDPASDPNAPGAPMQLGSTLPSLGGGVVVGGAAGPSAGQEQEGRPRSGGPLDLSAAGRGVPAVEPELPQGALPAPNAAPAPAAPPAVAAISPPRTAREEFDDAYELLRERRWAEAEMAFRSFLRSHPKDPNAPNATFQLGETYLRRNMHADAAEQYLKIHQTWPSAGIAPEALYKLALSLKGLDRKDQACGTLAEVGRRYPQASPALKATVDRELKRTGC